MARICKPGDQRNHLAGAYLNINGAQAACASSPGFAGPRFVQLAPLTRRLVGGQPVRRLACSRKREHALPPKCAGQPGDLFPDPSELVFGDVAAPLPQRLFTRHAHLT